VKIRQKKSKDTAWDARFEEIQAAGALGKRRVAIAGDA
jgi:hypothetical protein